MVPNYILLYSSICAYPCVNREQMIGADERSTGKPHLKPEEPLRKGKGGLSEPEPSRIQRGHGPQNQLRSARRGSQRFEGTNTDPIWV